MSRGALRRGEGTANGLLRCGHCGRKLRIAFSGTNGNTGRYHCQGGFINHGGNRCISFGGMRIDREVGTRGDRAPATAQESRLHSRRRRCAAVPGRTRDGRWNWRLSRAQLQGPDRARRQYDAVDPDNRLVAAELEKRWNERLAIVRNLETELEGLMASPATRTDARPIASG